MYECPISIAINSFIKDQTERADNEILYQATMQTGINIDKDELVKALRYDRDQYDKGYSDGIKDFAERLTFKIVNTPSEFTAEQGVVAFLNGLAHRQFEILDIVEKISKELRGEE